MMNDVQKYINQQLGFSTWRSYDNVLNRLRCTKSDEYKQILPSESGDEDAVDTPIFACKFAQKQGYEHFLALANEDGRVAIHNTDTKERFGQKAHFNAIFDLAWMFQQMKIVTVSADHSAQLFDVSNSELRKERIFTGHTRSVKTVAFRQDDAAVFATGARDGAIIVWDTRSLRSNNLEWFADCAVNRPDRLIVNSHISSNYTPTKAKKRCGASCGMGVSAANSVTGLVFQDDNTLVSCGAGDGAIKVWDLRKNYKSHKKEPVPKCVIPYSGATTRNGFSNLLIDNSGLKLYASCLDNVIYCYNIGTCCPEPVMKYTGHQNSTYFVKSSLSADGSYLISGSSDQNAYIWNVNNPLPLVRLTGHNAEVTCVAWRQVGDLTLITCSDDMKHKQWRVGPEIVPENWEIDGCGKAENLKTYNKIFRSKLKRLLEVNETTPQSQKKHIMQCDRCNFCVFTGTRCENCSTAKRKSPESLTNESKRLQTEKGPRRLFGNISENVPSSSTKESENDNKLGELTLEDLPNFVIDGVAPHLNYSPQKRPDKDWLTKLRVEKSLIREMRELAGPSPPKMPKIESSPRSRPRPKNDRCSSPQSPLLRFFKVTNNPAKCESQQCMVKSQNCNNGVQQTQTNP